MLNNFSIHSKKNALEENFSRLYQNLNVQQKSAVETLDGPVLVVAGPGTGKTQLLGMRVANILRQTDTPAGSILCLTFTEAAAINMRKRLEQIIGKEAFKVSIYTFHGFGLDFINQNPEHFNFTTNFKPADDLAKISILENILKDLEYDNPLKKYHPEKGWIFLSAILEKIGDLKKIGLSPEEFLEICIENQKFIKELEPILIEFFEQRISKKNLDKLPQLILDLENIKFNSTNFSKILEKETGFSNIKSYLLKELSEVLKSCLESQKTTALAEWKRQNLEKDYRNQFVLKDAANEQKHLSLSKVYKEYQNQLHKGGLFDFEDMLLETVRVLEENDNLRFTEQEKYLYILVDEFQDTNDIQMRLLANLINLEITENQPNILVVGDDDQGIYKFQGASITNILSFRDRYKNVKVVSLINNYRSNQEILDFADSVIDQAEKRLTELPEVNKKLIASKAVNK